MRSLNPYILSLSENKIKSISDMLSDVVLKPTAPQLGDIAPYAGIQPDSIGALTEIGPLDISLPMVRITNANRNIWDAIDGIERDLSSLEGINNGMLKVLATAIDRSNATMLAIGDMGVGGKTYDTVYVERFDNPNGTDPDYTTAVLSSGVLTIPYGRISTWPMELSCANSNMQITKTELVDKFLNVEGRNGTDSPTMLNTFCATLPSPKTVNVFTVKARAGTIKSVSAVLADGSSVELTNISKDSNTWTSSTQDMSIVAVRAVVESGAGVFVTTVVGEAIDAEAAASAITSTIQQTGDRFFPIVPRRGPIAILEYVFQTSVSIEVEYLYHFTTADWVSTPVTVEGDVKDFSIEVEETLPDGCGSAWWASIAGSDWIPIHPRNKDFVVGEVLSFDGGGKAYFRFDAEARDISLSCKGQKATGEIWIRGYDNDRVIGVCYLGDKSSPITVSYRPIDSDSLDPRKYGISSGSGQLIDMTTGGVPGEIIEANSRRVVLSHEPSIILDPTPNILVFADGVKVNILDDNQSLSDPSLKTVSCKISGKVVSFSADVGTVTVYYKYLKTSLRLKTTISSVLEDSGNLPKIDNVTYEVSHS